MNDEIVLPAGPTLDQLVANIAGVFPQAAEALREEGRREVLREIAAIDPWSDRGYEGFCNFCGVCMDKGAFGSTHEPSCLWLKALQVADSDIS